MNKLFYIFWFFFFVHTIQAQLSSSGFNVTQSSSDVEVCQDGSIGAYTVTAKLPDLNNCQIAFNLPEGVSYTPGSVLVTSSTGGSYTITEVNIADLNAPVFAISNGGNLSTNWGTGHQVFFTIKRTADCAAARQAIAGNTFKDTLSINYRSQGNLESATDDDPNYASYNCNYASLSILPIDVISTSIGLTETRDITVRQGGRGCTNIFEHYVVIGTAINNYQLSFGGTNLTPVRTASSGTTDTLFYNIDLGTALFSNIGNGDNCLDNGEDVTFTETFRVLSCTDNLIKHHAHWGCFSDLCQEAVPITGVVNFGNGVPALSLTVVSGSTAPDFCKDTATHVIRIINTGSSTMPAGSANAFDIDIIFGLGENRSAISTLAYNTLWGSAFRGTRFWGNFKIGNTPIADSALYYFNNPGSTRGTASYLRTDLLTVDPDGPGGFSDIDGDGIYNDLAEGDTIYVSLDYWIKPREDCGKGRLDYMRWEHKYFDVSFKDQCDNPRPPVRNDLGYRNIIRENARPTLEVAPTDIFDGDHFSVGVQPHLYHNGYLCNGESMTTSSSAKWSLEITVPTGIILDPIGQPDADLAAYNPTITQVGNKITYTLDRYVYDTLNIPLTIDCSQYTGPKNISIPYSTHYFCGTGTDTCFYREFHCGTLDITTHCPGNCKGPVTFLFEANRTTAGYTDRTRSTLVDLDPDIHNTTFYNAFDTMLVYAGAYMADTALDRILLDLRMTIPSGGAGLLNFTEGEVIINDVSSGLGRQTFALNNMPTNPTLISGNDYIYTVDISDYKDSIGGNFIFGGENGSNVYSADTVWIKAKFTFSSNFRGRDLHEISPFRAEYYSILNDNSKLACDDLGTLASYENVRFFSSVPNTAVSGCTASNLRFYLTHSAGSADDHPNEYRPPIHWDSTIVIVPSFQYTGSVTYTGQPYNPLPHVIRGDTMFIYRPVGYQDADKTSNYYPRYEVGVVGNCETPAITAVEGKIYFKEYAYHPDPSVYEDRVFSSGADISYASPTWSFQAVNPIISGVTDTASWDVEICNTTVASDIGFNWLFVEPQPNMDIIGAYDVATGNPLPFRVSNDSTFIEVGVINRAACKTVRLQSSYSGCTAQSLTVRHGWDCQDYPTDYSAKTSACYRTITLTVVPKPSEVQLGVLTGPSTPQALCTDTVFVVEINSAQLADVVNPMLDIRGVTGVSLTSVAVEYPSNSGNIEFLTPTINGDIATINLLDHTVINAHGGINGTATTSIPEERQATVTLVVEFGCGFASNSALAFSVRANRPCGDVAIGNGVAVKTAPVVLAGAASPYETLVGMTISPDTVRSCSAPTSVRMLATIIDGVTSNTDTLSIDLPFGVAYRANSYACNGVSCPSMPVVNTLPDGHEQLLFAYPAGLNSGEAMDFNFDIVGSAVTGGCSPAENLEITSYVQVNGLACGGVPCGPIRVVTGSSSKSVVVEKASLAITDITGYSVENLNGSEDYSLTFDITNNGSNSDAGLTIKYYCADANGNATANVIGTDVISFAINRGQTTSYTSTINVASACDRANGIAAVIVPGGGQCICDTVSFAFQNIPEQGVLNIDQDNDGILDIVEIYNGDADNDGVLDYMDNDFCAVHFQGVDGWNCSTQGLPDPDDDMDGDGIPNYQDTDFPTCGILQNGICSSFDKDKDGIPNHLDLDADNDGIPDVVEAGGTDTNGDGVQDNLTDTDSDGIVDLVDNDDTDGPTGSAPCSNQPSCVLNNSTSVLANLDTDGDSILNHLDLDADNDGIPDVVEAGGTDANGDGIADNYVDNDNDGFNDVVDGDRNNDGVSNNTTNALLVTGADNGGDGLPDSYPNDDFDGDSILNHLDLDADNDGIPDVVEAGGTDANGDGIADNYVDNDNDGFNDVVDGDRNNDGVSNNITNALLVTGVDNGGDGLPDSYPNGDFDGDSILNHLDLDADNDGIQDILEALGTDVNGDGMVDSYQDADNDGYHDPVDGDAGNDGVAENTANALLTTSNDANDDGQPESYPKANADGQTLPNFLDLDSDNDGITDVVENASGLTNTDAPGGAAALDGIIEIGTITDTNSDGWSDTQSGTSTIVDTDGDGISDPYDIDADNDGIPDYLEGTCSTCPTFGVPTGGDANNNGVLDTYESLQANNTNGGSNVGITPNEDDDDTVAPPDYLDLDSDNDNAMDWAEGFDNGFGSATAGDGNAVPEIINLAAAYVSNGGSVSDYPSTDTDSDGLPDWLDNLNGFGYNNGTLPPFLDHNSSFWIDRDNDGLADIFDNDVNGSGLGTTAPTPDNDNVSDRDWRDINSYVDFPIELISFNAERKSNTVVNLDWITASELNNSGFWLERMNDNETEFKEIQWVDGHGTTSESVNYHLIDENAYTGLSYYRLRQVDFDGTISYTDVEVVKGSSFSTISDIQVYPIPVVDVLNIRIGKLPEAVTSAKLRIISMDGQTLLSKVVLVADDRVISLDEVKDLPSENYYLQIELNNGHFLLEEFVKTK